MSFFRAVPSAVQSLPASTETELVYATELSDPDGVFASNRFTVPAGWNNRVGGITGCFRSSATETGWVFSIQKQTAGVGPFVSVVSTSNNSRNVGTVSAYPIVFSTGDVYRLVYIGTVGEKAITSNSFSGWVAPLATLLGMVRAEMTVNQSLGANAWQHVIPNTETIDSHNVYASGVLTVPAGFNGGFLHLVGGIQTIDDSCYLAFERSIDNGLTWPEQLVQDRCGIDGFSCTVDNGVIAAVTGERFRLAAFQSGSNFNARAFPRTFFSATLFKY